MLNRFASVLGLLIVWLHAHEAPKFIESYQSGRFQRSPRVLSVDWMAWRIGQTNLRALARVVNFPLIISDTL